MRSWRFIRTSHLNRVSTIPFIFRRRSFQPRSERKTFGSVTGRRLFNLLIGLNGYTVCSGVIDKKLNGKDIIAVPLADEGDMRIGYIMHNKADA